MLIKTEQSQTSHFRDVPKITLTRVLYIWDLIPQAKTQLIHVGQDNWVLLIELYLKALNEPEIKQHVPLVQWDRSKTAIKPLLHLKQLQVPVHLPTVQVVSQP